jgi:hypothetical protein
MVEPLAGVAEAGHDVLELEVWEFLEYLFVRESSREQVQNISDANPHTPNAGAASALAGIYGDAFFQVCHMRQIMPNRQA